MNGFPVEREPAASVPEAAHAGQLELIKLPERAGNLPSLSINLLLLPSFCWLDSRK
ncbi:hypothetical protein [Burkholderia cenocepacia]|uniref:hypothetical protein n=1 Tax=Burkholderia cenocepacia TaxID=95486 RepID=UPI0013A57B41|nr:hypothetical protein [Burkholderia cenocepacia]HEM7881883.1 hypothetical protein [Burkholderia cenocepacia]